jgi:histidine ammonia-lyase
MGRIVDLESRREGRLMVVVRLDGEHLEPEAVLAVARSDALVETDPAAMRKVERSRAVVDKLLESNIPVYGLNTGFGSLRDIPIGANHTRELQRNLIRSHCCGVGEPAPIDVVRAMLLLRANTLIKGHSGVRPVVIQQLVRLLNQRIHPVVPLKGSVGASGDLAPLSHLALVLMGEGEAFLPDGRRVSGAEAPASAGIDPLELEAKEGLALNNGTQFMTALGVLALLDAEYLTDLAIQASALSFEALQGVVRAYDPRLHEVRNQQGQKHVAQMLRWLTHGSEILSSPVNFGALNGACDSLEKAVGLLESANDSSEQFAAVCSQIRTLLANLVHKRTTLRDQFDAPIASPSPFEDVDERRHATARRLFADDVNQVERIYDLAFPLTAKPELARARKHLQIALERLQEVVPVSLPVQDDYSLRCTPQVIGAALDTLKHVRGIIARELNAATDNPLIFPPELPHLTTQDVDEYRRALSVVDCKRAVVSGGNFHGAPIALAMDQACIALAAVGNIAERRVFHLTTGRLSNGLPRSLTPEAGLQSGLMIAQVTAASLVSENKTLCHPASADSIPTVEDAEDHVSMGAFAARKFVEVVKNVRWIIAIELICAAQGVEFRQPAQPSLANAALLREVRVVCPFIEEDRPLGVDIENLAAKIRERGFPLFNSP